MCQATPVLAPFWVWTGCSHYSLGSCLLPLPFSMFFPPASNILGPTFLFSCSQIYSLNRNKKIKGKKFLTLHGVEEPLSFHLLLSKARVVTSSKILELFGMPWGFYFNDILVGYLSFPSLLFCWKDIKPQNHVKECFMCINFVLMTTDFRPLCGWDICYSTILSFICNPQPRDQRPPLQIHSRNISWLAALEDKQWVRHRHDARRL